MVVCTKKLNLVYLLPAPIAHASRSDKRPPNCMVSSAGTPVAVELSVVLVFLIEAGISWSVMGPVSTTVGPAPELELYY
jgi:hypothetical protein